MDVDLTKSSNETRSAMLKSGERSAQQLSQELGVSVWSLKRWSKEFPIGGPSGPWRLNASASRPARSRWRDYGASLSSSRGNVTF